MIRAHLERGGLDDGLVFDAVRVRLIEIEKQSEPSIHLAGPRALDPWVDVAGMPINSRTAIFDTARAIVQARSTPTPPTIAAVERLLGSSRARPVKKDRRNGREVRRSFAPMVKCARLRRLYLQQRRFGRALAIGLSR